MFDRAWILSILAKLPACYWPVLLWDVLRVGRLVRAYREANPQGGMVGIGVTIKGRIHIKWAMPADTPSETDWTLYARRAPWLGQDLDAGSAGFARFSAPAAGHWLEIGPQSACFPAALEPAFIDSG
ncbi:hypothetical protein WNY37_00320 [Henriciella sp. AS95]|uniref:hypothetical protein n=1 Tax=Henriciella sp. AS95 TaxID=3135782 RepID=UPI0031800FC0